MVNEWTAYTLKNNTSINHFFRYGFVLLMLFGQLGLQGQNKMNQNLFLANAEDTVSYMTDFLPRGVKTWPFNSDSLAWDLNGVKAPYIRKWVYNALPPEDREFEKANAMLVSGTQSAEYVFISGDSILSVGVIGVDLFKDGTLFKGSYHPTRLIRYKPIGKPGSIRKNVYKLVFPCDLNALPRKCLSQLPYQPDSIRIVTTIQEQILFRSNILLDLNLQRYRTSSLSKHTIQSTRIESRKSNLAWQDITRFIKYPGLFQTDTTRETSFYTQDSREPVATIYHTSNHDIQKVVYKAPETFKDLTTLIDFKANLFFFPNPYTFGLLRTEMIIKGAGLYTLRVVNLIGSEVWHKDYFLDADLTQDLDLSFLSKGTYFFVFEQDKNHVLATKRLLVIK